MIETIHFSIDLGQEFVDALILYATQQLEHGQQAKDLFAYLFAKQQALATA